MCLDYRNQLAGLFSYPCNSSVDGSKVMHIRKIACIYSTCSPDDVSDCAARGPATAHSGSMVHGAAAVRNAAEALPAGRPSARRPSDRAAWEVKAAAPRRRRRPLFSVLVTRAHACCTLGVWGPGDLAALHVEVCDINMLDLNRSNQSVT